MSSDPIISVENVGKKYRIRHREGLPYGTLREAISGALKAPFRRFTRSAPAVSTEDFWAVRDIDFTVDRGHAVGIIGRNGAGKSTLLKILSRITEPTTGRIRLRGRVASLLEVGTGFHPELSGRENVFLNGAILGMRRTEIARKFDEIVAFAGVERFVDTPVKRYSSGMYVRLAFAVAAHLEPEILIVDEVLAVGDAEFQRKCLGKMDDVAHRESRTILFVSHNMDAVRRLCGRAILLQDGRIRANGPAATVIEDYLSNFQPSDHIAITTYPASDPSAFHIERIEILDESGGPKPSVRTWDPVRFRIVFHSPRPLKNASVAFQISTNAGTALTLTSTTPDRTLALDFAEGRNTIDLFFPRLILSAGMYRFGAALAIPNVEVLFDGIEHGQLVVETRDVFDSGLPPQSARYLIPMEHEWQRQ